MKISDFPYILTDRDGGYSVYVPDVAAREMVAKHACPHAEADDKELAIRRLGKAALAAKPTGTSFNGRAYWEAVGEARHERVVLLLDRSEPGFDVLMDRTEPGAPRYCHQCGKVVERPALTKVDGRDLCPDCLAKKQEAPAPDGTEIHVEEDADLGATHTGKLLLNALHGSLLMGEPFITSWYDDSEEEHDIIAWYITDAPEPETALSLLRDVTSAIATSGGIATPEAIIAVKAGVRFLKRLAEAEAEKMNFKSKP